MVSAQEGAALSDMRVGGDLIVSPGVTGEVVLTDVTVEGKVLNLGDAKVTVQTPELPEEDPAILPQEVYTPTPTTGETILFRDKYEVPIYADRTPIKVKDGDFKTRRGSGSEAIHSE